MRIISVLGFLLLFFSLNASSPESSYRKMKRDAKTREQMAEDGFYDAQSWLILGGGVLLLFIYIGYTSRKKQKELTEKREQAKQGMIDKVNALVAEGVQFDNQAILEKIKSHSISKPELDQHLKLAEAYHNHKCYLDEKYNDPEIVSRLLNQAYWVGMTKEQLIDSAGTPDKQETHTLKTKTKEIYIYGNKSSGDVFTLENDIVVSFKDR